MNTGGNTGATVNPADSPITISLYEKWKKIHPLWVSGGFQTWRRIVLVILVLVFYVNPWLSWNGDPGVRFGRGLRKEGSPQMILLNPNQLERSYPDEQSREIMRMFDTVFSELAACAGVSGICVRNGRPAAWCMSAKVEKGA